MKRFDRSFLEKISVGETYHGDYESYKMSVINEIGNILSCRLKSEGGISENPFSYGIKDLLSQDISKDDLDIFRINCQRIVKELEPRILDIEFTDLKVNARRQVLELAMKCVLKLGNQKIYQKMLIS